MWWSGEFGAWLRTKFESELDINEKIKPILDRQGIGSRIQDQVHFRVQSCRNPWQRKTPSCPQFDETCSERPLLPHECYDQPLADRIEKLGSYEIVLMRKLHFLFACQSIVRLRRVDFAGQTLTFGAFCKPVEDADLP
jgi:hypothetical protein